MRIEKFGQSLSSLQSIGSYEYIKVMFLIVPIFNFRINKIVRIIKLVLILYLDLKTLGKKKFRTESLYPYELKFVKKYPYLFYIYKVINRKIVYG